MSTFDLIVFDPSVELIAQKSLQVGDGRPGIYQALTRFFREARRRLTAKGRILIFFGTSGDLGYLRHLVRARSTFAGRLLLVVA